MHEQVFTNARLVLADRVIRGSLVARDGRIAVVEEAPSHLPGALDLEGDLLLPGLVDIHTDNLERHMMPRAGTPWPPTAAVVAHDAQIAAAGITTVLNALSLGDIAENSDRIRNLGRMVEALTGAVDAGMLRAEHLLHLRCEVCFPGLQERLDELVEHPLTRMLSVMDHTPGQGQFESIEVCYTFYQGKYGFSDARMESFIATCRRNQELYAERNRAYVVQVARSRGLALASHDDADEAHVARSVGDGVSVAEFPTTLAAARASHAAGLGVTMGAPNVVRGGSHSGNVSAVDLAADGCLDIVCSDYVPHSQLHAAMALCGGPAGYDLARAVRAVTKTPAGSIGLQDRGELAPGRRADLLRVRPVAEMPIIRGVWREGVRMC